MSKKSNINKDILRQFWQFTRPDKKLFITSLFGASSAVLIQNVIPQLIVARAFNRLQALYATHQPLDFKIFMPYLVGYIILSIIGFLIWRAQVVITWTFEVRSMQRMVEKVFNHIQHQSSAFHANRFGGALVSQVNKFINGYERIMDDFMWAIVPHFTSFVASIVILFIVNPLYAFTLLLVSLLYFFVMYHRLKKQFPYDRKLAISESDRTAKIADNITNVSTVRAYAGEMQEADLFHEQASTTSKKYFDLFHIAAKNDMIAHSGTAMINILAFTTGVLAVTTLKAPAGALYLAVSYTMTIVNHLWEARRNMRNINRALGDASEMAEILNIEPEIRDLDNPDKLAIQEGSIAFNDVTFSYKDSLSPVFKNLNFEIKGGEKIGLVGPSGGGKTTITSLLQRFVDIQKGSIKIDGQDIAHIAQTDLRNHIAYVPQDPLMFHRSIADNIRYGKPEATQAEIEAVAKLAHAHDFIKELSDGYNTLVGERGIKLSGGQRQRVAIARAMLKDAPILVLDEATSALDSGSEKLIQDALWKLMEGRTTLVIAHRLSTIQHMDRIIVLDKGKIVEQGDHHQLRNRKGLYAKLWAHQSGGFIDE